MNKISEDGVVDSLKERCIGPTALPKCSAIDGPKSKESPPDDG